MKKVMRVVRKVRTAVFTTFAVSLFAVSLLAMSYGTEPASANCLVCKTCEETSHICQFQGSVVCISCGSSAGCYALECGENGCGDVTGSVDQDVINTTCNYSCGVTCSN